MEPHGTMVMSHIRILWLIYFECIGYQMLSQHGSNFLTGIIVADQNS